MKNVFSSLVVVTALASPSFVQASSVFQCTNEQGITTFSFTPCTDAAPVAETRSEDSEAENSKPVVSKKAQLAQLDMEILELRDEIDLIKREYKDAIATNYGKRGSDELTNKFDSDTMRLISELNSLQSERARVARL